ncbi:MAG: ribonuclease HII [Verrucomicrobiota bacterium]
MNALQKHDNALLENCSYLIGVDEAGRGALAGPVTAGASVLSKAFFEDESLLEQSGLVNDSKQMSAQSRERQYAALVLLRDKKHLDFEVASSTTEEIEELNILGATRLAMRRAVEALAKRSKDWDLPLQVLEGPLFESSSETKLIVDGRALKPFPYAHEGIVKGDGKSLAIAIASIAAKVARDRLMQKLAARYPIYDFGQHKGYATAAHRAAILSHGACMIHRSLFLRKILSK